MYSKLISDKLNKKIYFNCTYFLQIIPNHYDILKNYDCNYHIFFKSFLKFSVNLYSN